MLCGTSLFSSTLTVAPNVHTHVLIENQYYEWIVLVRQNNWMTKAKMLTKWWRGGGGGKNGSTGNTNLQNINISGRNLPIWSVLNRTPFICILRVCASYSLILLPIHKSHSLFLFIYSFYCCMEIPWICYIRIVWFCITKNGY